MVVAGESDPSGVWFRIRKKKNPTNDGGQGAGSGWAALLKAKQERLIVCIYHEANTSFHLLFSMQLTAQAGTSRIRVGNTNAVSQEDFEELSLVVRAWLFAALCSCDRHEEVVAALLFGL